MFDFYLISIVNVFYQTLTLSSFNLVEGEYNSTAEIITPQYLYMYFVYKFLGGKDPSA